MKRVWQQQRCGGEPVRTQEKLGDLGRGKGDTDSDGHVMRRLEWFGNIKRGDETESIRAVAEMKMEGKRIRVQP